MRFLCLTLLYIVPLGVVGNIEQGGPLWLFIPAFASVLLGWYLGRREGDIW